MEPKSAFPAEPTSVERVIDPDYLETLTRLRSERFRKEEEKRKAAETYRLRMQRRKQSGQDDNTGPATPVASEHPSINVDQLECQNFRTNDVSILNLITNKKTQGQKYHYMPILQHIAMTEGVDYLYEEKQKKGGDLTLQKIEGKPF